MCKKATFFAVLFALLCFCAAARAAEEPFLNGYLRDHQKGVSLTCWYEEGNDPADVDSALCAVYNGRGQLVSVTALDAKKEAQTVVIPCKTSEVDHAKLMTLDAARKPLRSVRTLKPSAESAEAPQFLTDPVISENAVSVTGSAMAYARIVADRPCRLYWALYKHDAGHPTSARFQSGDLPGSESHGMQPMSGNQPYLLQLNNLLDQMEYDLFLWLSNADFSASSYMRLLNFRTVDSTPPVFLSGPTPETVRERSVTLQYSLSENATLYWVLVESGTRFPNPPTGGGTVTKDYAIKQVIAGNGGLNHGKSTVRANASAMLQLQNLAPEKSYDVWYVAQDAAGNCSEFRTGSTSAENTADNPRGVCMLTVSTLDKQPPSVTVEATSYPDGHPETPYADTGIRLLFSEEIRRFSTGEVLSNLYDAVKNARNDTARDAAKETLAAFLRATIALQTGSGNMYQTVPERKNGTETDWVIDYRNAIVSQEEETLVLTFPTTNDSAGDSALRLAGGKSYCFQLQDLSDLSENLNQIKYLRTASFTTMPAQILLQEFTLTTSNYPSGVSDVDLAFTATPVAVSRADGDTAWDLLFWSDTACAFEVYYRSRPSTSIVYDKTWARMGSGTRGNILPALNATGMTGQSAHLHLCQYTTGEIPLLKTLEDGRVYEYAVRFLEVDGDPERKLWDSEVKFGVSFVAGSASGLLNLSANLTQDRFSAAKSSGSVQEIGSPAPLMMTRVFHASAAPTFTNGAPTFTPSNNSVSMWFQMTRPGTVHYLIAPAGGTISAQDQNGRAVNWSRYLEIPESGQDTHLIPFTVKQPSQYNIIQQRFSGAGVKTSSVKVDSKGTSVEVTGLKSDTHYFAYFILQGTAEIYSTYAQLYRFTTLEAAPPTVRITLNNPSAELSVTQEAVVDYLVVDTAGSMLDPVVNSVFWNSAPSGGRQPMSSYMQVNSVLEAMTMDTGNGSVFDVYATKEYKEKVAQYVRQSLANGSSVIGIGKGLKVSPTSSLTVDCSLLPMVEGHKYAIISVTQSADGGPNVFRAVYPITPPDKNPPLVMDITQNLTMDGSESLELNTCSGNVTLTFDSNLYYLNGDVMKAVDLGPHYSTLRSENFTPLVDLGSSSPAGQIAVSSGQVAQVNRLTSSINLTLKNAASGATITFPTKLCDEYGNMNTVALTVTLRVSTTLTGYDSAGRAVYVHKPEISVSKLWDGRSTD
ncbi:MAG: hypothetical protein IJR54_02570 [Oscillibacter sp.]|nr:hypothetical protein [Oscillibacter sp.]